MDVEKKKEDKKREKMKKKNDEEIERVLESKCRIVKIRKLVKKSSS